LPEVPEMNYFYSISFERVMVNLIKQTEFGDLLNRVFVLQEFRLLKLIVIDIGYLTEVLIMHSGVWNAMETR
jgi:hypothetical protein